MPRIVKDPDERRSELISTAQQFFFTKGYENTSVSDIVKAVGVAQGTFYYYFDSKIAILEALVTEITSQMITQFQSIIADENLNAIQKWTKAIQGIGDWKFERKTELFTFARVLSKDENLLLRYKLVHSRMQAFAPLLAEIIVQGVEEGVFETEYPDEAAEIAYAISNAFSEKLTHIVLNPDEYDNPVEHFARKYTALISGIERVLGAKPGSLLKYDEQMIGTWFEDET
jgi:AcrR family transcriptional regulator